MSTDTIIVTFDRYDDDQKIDTYQKSFTDEATMYDWCRKQEGHPFLSDRIVKIEPFVPDTELSIVP